MPLDIARIAERPISEDVSEFDLNQRCVMYTKMALNTYGLFRWVEFVLIRWTRIKWALNHLTKALDHVKVTLDVNKP